MDERELKTIIPHADHGDPACCGCLDGIVLGDQANILCNECGAVVRTVPATEIEQVLLEMESALPVASEKCPHCGEANSVPGFTKLIAVVCQNCSEPVTVP